MKIYTIEKSYFPDGSVSAMIVRTNKAYTSLEDAKNAGMELTKEITGGDEGYNIHSHEFDYEPCTMAVPVYNIIVSGTPLRMARYEYTIYEYEVEGII